MVRELTALCLAFLCLGLSTSQRLNRHDTLQNMINYNAQFQHKQSIPVQVQEVPNETAQLEQDPFVRSLFKEFLAQYQQLAASEQQTEVPTTTTTAAISNEIDFAKVFASRTTTQPPAPLFVHPNPQIAPAPQRRRLQSPKRKSNTPQTRRPVPSTTPFSTLLSRSNVHQQEFVESTTSFPSLRQKYFGIDSSRTKESIPRAQQSFRRTQQSFNVVNVPTTTQAPVVVEEVPSTTQAPKPAPPNFKLPPRVINAPTKIAIPTTKVVIPARKAVAIPESEFDEAEFRRQAQSAKYEFSSDINDGISGNLQQREEVRDGLAVRGKYSFSDGYFKRTVHYEADDKGYRVVKEDVEPLDGPHNNPDGQARVSSYVDGNTVNYQITKDDIVEKNQKRRFNFVDVEDELPEGDLFLK